jgi:phosphate transport system permease protein
MSTSDTPASPVLDALTSAWKMGRPRSTLIRDLKERTIVGLLVLCGIITISITLLIVVILAWEATGFFGGEIPNREKVVTLWAFLTEMTWNPVNGADRKIGIWPLITGTFQVTFVAMCLAIPLGLIVAIWLSEFASERVRAVMKPLIEIIAGIPTVVFGFFALTFVTPVLQEAVWVAQGWVGIAEADRLRIEIFNALSAGVTVGIMCIPIVASLSEDALRAVPRALREGSYGLGASRFETSVRVVFPAALSGIVAACLLAFARAVGETMIVAIAAGLNPPNLAQGLGEVFALNHPTQTMTGYMVSVFFGDMQAGSAAYQSVYAVGMTLFLVTLVITLFGALIRKKFRQQYE